MFDDAGVTHPNRQRANDIGQTSRSRVRWFVELAIVAVSGLRCMTYAKQEWSAQCRTAGQQTIVNGDNSRTTQAARSFGFSLGAHNVMSWVATPAERKSLPKTIVTLFSKMQIISKCRHSFWQTQKAPYRVLVGRNAGVQHTLRFVPDVQYALR